MLAAWLDRARGRASLIVSRIILGVLIAIASVVIVLALTAGVTLVAPFDGPRWSFVYRSEGPTLFWLSVVAWATVLGVALWTVIRLIRSGLL
jgi:hypothetical protein